MDYTINGYILMEFVLWCTSTVKKKHCSLVWVIMSDVQHNGDISVGCLGDSVLKVDIAGAAKKNIVT